MTPSRQRNSPCLWIAAVTAGALAVLPGVARADDVDDDAPPRSASPSAGAGAFLPSALSPRSDGRSGLVAITGGLDRARGGAIYDATAEAHLLGPVSLVAGAAYDGPGTTTSPHLELRLDAARQATHGVDVAVAAGYTNAGFNLVPAAVARIALGRNLGASYVLANVAYEQGLEDGEQSGELRLAALHPISAAVHVGLDSRLQVDLEHNHDPNGEAAWEWRSGLVASYAWNRLVFTGTGGVSALRFHTGPTEVGPVVTAGVGTIF